MCDIYICITFFLYQVIEVFGVLHFSFDNNNDTLAIGSNLIVTIALYFDRIFYVVIGNIQLVTIFATLGMTLLHECQLRG